MIATEARRRWCFHLAGVGAFFALWEMVGRASGNALLAPPSEVVPALGRLVRDGEALRTLGSSMRQMFLGYVLGCALGMPIGILMGRSRLADGLLHPWLNMLIVTSVASFLPLLIMVVGTGFEFRLLIVLLSCIFYITLISYQGARDVSRRWLDVGRSYGATPLTRFGKIILPATLPYLMAAARIGLGAAIRGMVVGELFILVGFGGLLHHAGYEVSTARLLALLLLLMIVSLTSNEGLRWLARRFAPWQADSRATERES